MNWTYLFKHWLYTLLLGPLVSQILMCINDINPYKIVHLLGLYPLSLLFGLFFSTPTYILYGFVYFYLAKNEIKIKYAKSILILLAIIGVIITTLMIKGSMMLDIAISYSISSIITGIFIKLNFEENQ